ncbi:hypothetical protein [Amycolatopsis sp. FDAARGOS 1241]|uniref:hypothetical protein n=1 Tax=Amycolatopsis sp. FDAARGOS 1241 TaxID=2778070 RepID=UPI00194F8ACD|nr:hypothetical protein [Amycolatopsis sp. FDAARGOS 1241]QRP45123.1 hypothetical protein I6J71_39060 [Amycolatopsis sp. FDAARGOS 1241]
MFWPVPDTWKPRDDAELVAGWRLWLELSDRAWPSAAWNGTPADAVDQLRDLLEACDDIETCYRQSCADPVEEFVHVIQGLVLCASAVIGLWWDDYAPLDPDRATKLHEDLQRFAAHAEQVLTLLATHGGWAALDSVRRRPA